MAKLPCFPIDAREYLLDGDISSLSLEEKGALLDLWCHAWINKYKRGYLLSDKKNPISDEKLASMLKISPEEFLKIKKRLVGFKLLRMGKCGELFSRRQSKFKTKYELYEKVEGENQAKNGKKRKSYGDFLKESETIGSDTDRIGNGIGNGIGNNTEPIEKQIGSDAKILLKFFGQKYKKLYGYEYHSIFKRDTQILKDIRKQYDFKVCQKIILLFFHLAEQGKDEFVKNNPSIPILKAKIPGLVAKINDFEFEEGDFQI